MASKPAREAANGAAEVDQSEATAAPVASETDAMEAMFAKFMMKFEQRLSQTQEAIVSQVDRKIQEVRDEFDEAQQMTSAQEAAGMIPPAPQQVQRQPLTAGGNYGQFQPVNGLPSNMVIGPDGTLRFVEPQAPPTPQQIAQQQAAQRKVAFIPKDDPLNPRSLSFDCWLNGNRIRIKRGDVGMLPLGFALDLAKAGHGHVIDMAAMSQIPVQTLPDESLGRPSDGPPIPDPNMNPGLVSSIPRSWLQANPLS